MKTEEKAINSAAKNILKQIEQMWGKEHSFSGVDANSFHHLDLRFYSRIEEKLEGIGFKKLGDIEDISSFCSKLTIFRGNFS